MKPTLWTLSALCALCFCNSNQAAWSQESVSQESASRRDSDAIHETSSVTAAQILAGAKAQIGKIRYDAGYYNIPYPNGDVPGNRGLCADVVVRALRYADYDLQRLIHEDRQKFFASYPKTWGWGRRSPDPNTDHRSVANQMHFFARYGQSLTTTVSSATLAQWEPGDVVYWKTGTNTRHAGIISDKFNAQGVPLVIHMSSTECVMDDSLRQWPILGHFRTPVQPDLEEPPASQDGEASPEAATE